MLSFYSGSDIYRLRSAITGASATIDFGDRDDRTELERTLKYPSLFGERITIVIRNVFSDADTADTFKDLLETYAVSTLADITLAVCREGDGGRESAATKALQAYLTKHSAHTAVFGPLKGSEQEAWIKQYCAERGCQIDPQAIASLIRRTGGDSWVLANELSKLCAYSYPLSINLAAVDTLVPLLQERDEFELSNALAAGNKRQALAALWRRLKEGAAEQLILGLLAYSVRTLLTRSGSGISSQKLQQAHAALAQLDRDGKSGASAVDDRLFAVILDM